MRIGYTLYNLLLPVAGLAARLAALFNDKIAAGIEGRRGLRKRWVEKARGLDASKHLVWFHVSSAGEFEQAKPVMNLISERHGRDAEIALTFFSPSGMHYYERFDRSKRIEAVKFVDYLPIDTRGNARFCLSTLRPRGIIYVKYDLWPNLIAEAARCSIPQVLVSATLSPGSKRLSSLVRRFYSGVYSRLDAIAAISDEDADRFGKGIQSVGSRGSASGPEIITAGDTRFDQVCRRIDTSTVVLPRPLKGSARSFVIAGSTWPRDEEVVIPGFARILARFPEAGLIVVPHEPTPARLGEIDRALAREGLSYTLLSTIGDDVSIETPVVIADGIGYLAELYRVGFCAYVGGSFTTGVHNVMEPAVLGLPVFFGPRIDNSYEARRLVELETGRIVKTARQFEEEVGMLFSDRTLREERARTGSRFIRDHCGAADRCVDAIEKHLKLSGR